MLILAFCASSNSLLIPVSLCRSDVTIGTESVGLCLIVTLRNTIVQCLQVLGRFLLFNLRPVYLLTKADYLDDEVIASLCVLQQMHDRYKLYKAKLTNWRVNFGKIEWQISIIAPSCFSFLCCLFLSKSTLIIDQKTLGFIPNKTPCLNLLNNINWQ